MKFIYKSDPDETQISWGSNDDSTGLLTVGETYDGYIEIHSSYSHIILDKCPNLKFNSVCFESTLEHEEEYEEEFDMAKCEFYEYLSNYEQALCRLRGIGSFLSDCEDNKNCHYKQLHLANKRIEESEENQKHFEHYKKSALELVNRVNADVDKIKKLKNENSKLVEGVKKIRGIELKSLDIDWDEYECSCRETDYSAIITTCEEILGSENNG